MPSQQALIDKAADILRRGGIIAYPTETVYGLGCLPDNETALSRLIDIKGRDADMGFILLASEPQQLTPYTANLTNEQWQTIARRQARATTWTVPVASSTSALLTGRYPQIAVRVSKHPTVTSLCNTIGSPLVSTSANFSGEPPSKSADALPSALCLALDYLLRGNCGSDPRPSRIIELATGNVLRD